MLVNRALTTDLAAKRTNNVEKVPKDFHQHELLLWTKTQKYNLLELPYYINYSVKGYISFVGLEYQGTNEFLEMSND